MTLQHERAASAAQWRSGEEDENGMQMRDIQIPIPSIASNVSIPSCPVPLLSSNAIVTATTTPNTVTVLAPLSFLSSVATVPDSGSSRNVRRPQHKLQNKLNTTQTPSTSNVDLATPQVSAFQKAEAVMPDLAMQSDEVMANTCADVLLNTIVMTRDWSGFFNLTFPDQQRVIGEWEHAQSRTFIVELFWPHIDSQDTQLCAIARVVILSYALGGASYMSECFQPQNENSDVPQLLHESMDGTEADRSAFESNGVEDGTARERVANGSVVVTVPDMNGVSSTEAKVGRNKYQRIKTFGSPGTSSPTSVHLPIPTPTTPYVGRRNSNIDTLPSVSMVDAAFIAPPPRHRIRAVVSRAIKAYFRKWKGGEWPRRPRIEPVQVLWSVLTSFLFMFLLGWVSRMTQPLGYPLTIGSFGATVVLMFSAWDSALIQPMNLIGGHLVSAVIGVGVGKIIPVSLLGLRVATSVSISIGAMEVLNVKHPPGGAIAMIAVSQAAEEAVGFMYVMVPCLTGTVACLILGLITNNMLPSRSYPKHWLMKI